MAKLKDDQIRWILSLDAKGVQGELTTISSVTQRLIDDNKKLEAELKAATRQMSAAEKEMKKLSAAGKEDSEAFREAQATYDSAANDVADYKKRIRDNTKAITENKAKTEEMVKTLKIEDMTMNQLKQRAYELQKQLDNTSKKADPEVYKALDNELTEVKNRMGELKKGAKDVESSLGGLSSGWKSALAVFAGNMMTKAVDKIKEWVSAGIDWVKSGIDMAKSAEGVVTAFNKLDNSKRHLADMREATKETISDLKLMEKTVRANEMGISIQNMANLLQFAQIQAKKMKTDVDYMADSIVDGLGRKSTMILDNLGISAGQVQAEFKKTGDFTAAVLKIVNERLKENGDEALTGAEKAAQASTKWENAQLKVGQKFQWLGETWDTVKGKMADQIEELIGDTRSLSEQYQSQIEKVADLEVNVGQLMPRYTELSKKTRLTKDEHKELDSILQQVARAIPIAVTEWDRYGNAVAISTEKVNSFIKAEKIRLRLMFEDKLKEKRSQLVDYVSEFEELQKKIDTLNSGGTVKKWQGSITSVSSGAAGGSFVPITDEEVVAIRKRYAEVKALVSETNEEINYMNGTSSEKEAAIFTKTEEKRNEFNAMNKKQLDAWIKDEKNAANEYLQIAKQVYNERFTTNMSAPSAGNKQTDENKKALEQQLKDLDDYIIREKNKLAEQRLDNTLSLDQYQKEQERLELEALERRFEIYNLEPAKQQEILNLILQYKIKFHEEILKEEELFNEKMEEAQSDALDRGISGLEQFGKQLKQDQKDLWNDQTNELIKRKQMYIDLGMSFSNEMGGLVGGFVTGNEDIIKSSLQTIINMALDALKAQVQISIAGVTAQSLAQPDSILTFGATGLARAAVIVGLIEAAFAVAKSVVGSALSGSGDTSSTSGTSGATYRRVANTGLADGGFNDAGTDGGYTGPGGRYQVKGVFPNGVTYHAGEYVVAQPEMKIPVVSNMVHAIEGIRRQRTDSNPLPAGGGMADGGYNGDSSATYMVNRDSANLNNTLLRLEQVIGMLEKKGVQLNYREFEITQERMDKIKKAAARR